MTLTTHTKSMHSVNILCKSWNVSLLIALQTLSFSFFLSNDFIHFWLCDRQLIRSTKLKFQTLYIIKGLSRASQPQLLHLKNLTHCIMGFQPPSSCLWGKWTISWLGSPGPLVIKDGLMCSVGFGISATGILFGYFSFLRLIRIPCFQSGESDDRQS